MEVGEEGNNNVECEGITEACVVYILFCTMVVGARAKSEVRSE